MMGVLGVLSGLAIFIVGFLVGLAMDIRKTVREFFGKYGIDRDTPKMFKEAAEIFNGIVNVRDLDGDYAIDVLSVGTEKRVRDWLARYRKKIEGFRTG